MVLNLATTGAAAFPIWMESHSGNASDKKILQEGASKMQAFCEQLKNAPTFLYVGDSAFYERCVKENVQFKWLSQAPERLKEVKKWVQLPENAFTWQALGNGYKMTPLLDAVYGYVPQRWLMILGCRITGEITENSAQLDLIKRRKGRFILATNQMDTEILPDIELLSEYKKQYKTEQGFAFIKGNTFEVASIFLKNLRILRH